MRWIAMMTCCILKIPSNQFLLQPLENARDIVDRLFHLLVVAFISMGNQFVDLAVGDLSQDAIAFTDGQQYGIQHGVYAAYNLRVRALQIAWASRGLRVALPWKHQAIRSLTKSRRYRTHQIQPGPTERYNRISDLDLTADQSLRDRSEFEQPAGWDGDRRLPRNEWLLSQYVEHAV